MKMGILAILLMLSTSASADTFFSEPDKQKHMIGSAIGANLMYAAGLTKWQAFGAMLAIGALKELGDGNSNTEHGRDMLANAIGASTVFVWSIKF